jgi:hypothetical protein
MGQGGVASSMYRPGVALALAATLVLAGCGRERSAAPAPAPPTRTVSPSTLSPGTTLVSSLPRLLRIVDGYHMFEVSPQQYEIIGRRVPEVLGRQRLSDQGVRFGANHDPAKDLHFVLIDPGFSHLSARQILNRLLGI